MFEEYQYQRRLIPWLLIAFIWAASIWHIYHNGFSMEHLVYDISILILVPLTITLFLFFLKLSIKNDKNYFTFKMFPFHWSYRKIKLEEISNATIKEYNTDRTFHGWGMGIPWNKNYKSYTVKGYKAVEISLKNGKKIFIGTQQPDNFIESLNIE